MPGIPLVFAEPFILGFLAALPVLWWLLRLTPPNPRKVTFPALALLRDLAAPEQTPARTPWWLLLLRLAAAALVITAFAEPLLDPQPVAAGSGAVLIAVDNDWASARAWDARQDALHRLIEQAARENRDVFLLPTAPPATGDPMQIVGPMAAKAAYSVASGLTPVPWPADWQKAKELLSRIDHDRIAYSLWLASGLGGPDAAAFDEALKSFDALGESRVFGDPETPVYTLAPPKEDDQDNAFSIMRANADSAASVTIAAYGAEGQSLAHAAADFTAGAPRATATLDLPLDLRNQVRRIEIEGQRTAAATVLLDGDWQRRPVGLIGDKAQETGHSLLSGLFYIDRALDPFADIHIDRLDKLLGQNMTVLVLTDATPLDAGDIPELTEWIKKGGVFVRFAGDRLAAGPDPRETALLPVALRTGDRAMGGALSWATPQKLQAFPASSPFHDLVIPPDVTVNRQILAEPSADLAQKTWAALADGTPLVTAKPVGRGISILFHVPAQSEWSNLPLSGLFVDMLRRIVDLGRAAAGAAETNFSSLAPRQTLDAFGGEEAPGPAARPIESGALSRTRIGPDHPPGIYGNSGFTRALNLGPAIGQPDALRGIAAESYRLGRSETDLKAPLLAAAFLLLLIDFLLSLSLRGILDYRSLAKHAGKTAAVFLLVMLPFHSAQADDDKGAVEFTSKTYLAYIETGDRETDRISEAGLTGLAHVLQNRTSLDHVGVTGVDPESGELAFFPLLYWPLNPAEAPLSPEAARRVNDYLHHGGMILFDSGDSGMLLAEMKHILAGVDVPPLVRIPNNHVLRRSFYLLDEFPGRDAGGDLWLEPEDLATFDGVAAVIAGSGGWAGAWAVDQNGRPFFPCTPGGEAQREQAYRFGVNIVMYALTGNYKSDQLHVQALLQRMRK